MLEINTIINPSLSHNFNNFLKYTTEEEKNGIIILNEVIKSKGTSKLGKSIITQEDVFDINELDHNNIDYSKSEKFLRYKNMKSSYEEFYGKVKNYNTKTLPLKALTLKELNFNKFLTEDNLKYIQSWVSIEEDYYFLDIASKALNALLARYESELSYITESKSKYN